MGNKLINASVGLESTIRAVVSASPRAAFLLRSLTYRCCEMFLSSCLNPPVCLVGASGDELGQQASGLPFVYLL